MDLPLIPGTLAVGWCPSSEQDRYNKYFALGVAQLSLGTGYTIKVSDTPPTAEERTTTLWHKTIAGVPDLLYIYYSGYWIAKHEAPAGGDERRFFMGSEADVWAYDGGDGTDPGAGGANVTDYTGAMWRVDHDFDFRFPIGAGTNPVAYDGSAATSIGVAATGGVERVALSEDELPAHTHKFEDDQFGKWQADGNDSDDNEGLIGSVVGTAGAYEPETDSTGGDKSHTNMPPYKGVYFIRRTGRKFRTA
jgi:microcystin-dependent protein